MGIHHLFLIVDQPHFHHFRNAKLCKLLVGQIPELIAFITKIFQSYPDRMLQISDHIGRPIIIDLKTPHLYCPVVYIHPVIRYNISDRLYLCLVFQIQFRNQHAQCPVIPIRKSFGNAGRFRRDVVHSGNQILDRHG